MGRYLIDSNVIVNYTSEKFHKEAMSFLADVIDEIPKISVITKIETLSWHSTIIQEEVSVKSFINSSNVIALSDNIVEKCIEIRRNCKIKPPMPLSQPQRLLMILRYLRATPISIEYQI